VLLARTCILHVVIFWTVPKLQSPRCSLLGLYMQCLIPNSGSEERSDFAILLLIIPLNPWIRLNLQLPCSFQITVTDRACGLYSKLNSGSKTKTFWYHTVYAFRQFCPTQYLVREICSTLLPPHYSTHFMRTSACGACSRTLDVQHSATSCLALRWEQCSKWCMHMLRLMERTLTGPPESTKTACEKE